MLIRQYGDRRTTYAWECEFRAAKQTDKESVVEFFDRLYAMAAQAFPPAAELGPDSSVMHSIVSSRFIDGLRFPLMRRSLLDHPLPNLELLKLRAMELEATELTMTRHANSTIRTNFVTDDDTAAVSDVSNSRKRGRGEADTNDVTNQVSNQLASGSQNARRYVNVHCHYCRERGHLKRDCPKLAAKRQRDGEAPPNTQPSAPNSGSDSNNRQQPSGRGKTPSGPKCFRCGRFGHMARDCRSTFHFDGRRLDPPAASNANQADTANGPAPPANNQWVANASDVANPFVEFVYDHPLDGDGDYDDESSEHLN